MNKLTLAAMFLAGSVSTSLAGDYEAAKQTYLDSAISGWVFDPVIVAALKSQNAETQSYDQAQINTMDLDWRAQVGSGNAPLVDAVLGNPDAAHFGEIEFDESSQTYQGQISVSVIDPETGEVVGAMTVGVDAEALL